MFRAHRGLILRGPITLQGYRVSGGRTPSQNRYSFGNVLAIARQRPGATHAGFHASLGLTLITDALAWRLPEHCIEMTTT